MFGPVRAVIVDDIPSHLFCISTAFASASIPFTPYWYDKEELNPRDKLKPPPYADGHEFLRVIFTDLNLDENPPGNLAEVINPVINVIRQLTSEAGGPYAVIFWTRMTHTIDDIRAELLYRLSASNILLPIAIDEITKERYLTPTSNEHSGEDVLKILFTETFAKPNHLSDEINRVLSKYGILLMLSKWESRAIHAAGKSSNQLFSAATVANECNEEDMIITIKKIASIVAREAVGFSSAKSMPANAYDAAMLDILVDSFNQSVNEKEYSDFVSNEIQSVIEPNIPINNQENVCAKLNKIFHIETGINGVRFINRGAVIAITDAIKYGLVQDDKTLCSTDDYFWPPDRIQIPTQLRIDDQQKVAITTILQNGDKAAQRSQSPFNHAVRTYNDAVKEQTKQAQEQIIKNKIDFDRSIRWVLIEIGADCDHAQNKPRTLRFLCAAMVPAEYVTNYVLGGKKNRLVNEALKLLGPYDIDGQIFYLLISLKRFSVWQAPNSLPDIKVLYRLRKSIIDFLLNNYSSWSMRPGITEYKPNSR